MNSARAWQILKIEPTSSKREIRKAYAEQAKTCHPEEQPEQFALLQEAYQLVLKLQEQEDGLEIERELLVDDYERVEITEERIEEAAEVSEIPQATPSNEFVSIWQEEWEEEQKRRLNTAVMQELRLLFENHKVAKSDKIWAEFCKSDLFLEKYFDVEFAEALDYYLESQTFYDHSELPQGFLVEMAIAYAMTPELDGCMYRLGGIPMRRVVAKYWNMQTEMWRVQRGTRILLRAENKARIQAFTDYIYLRTLEKQGLLLEEKEEQWFSIVWHGETTYLYEVSKGTYGQATSTTILRLFSFWILKENMPYFMIQRMYQRYQLSGIEKSHYFAIYKELKEAILNKYPDIEKDDVQDAIMKWIYRLIGMESGFMARTASKFEPETEEEIEEIHKHFASEIWKKYWDHHIMMQKLWEKSYFNNIPKTIARYLYDTYRSDGGSVTKYRQRLIEKSRAAILFYEKSVEQTPVEYWEYLVMRGFGICTREAMPEEIGGNQLNDDWQKYICDNRLYLPAYIKTKYRAYYGWQKDFVGYNVETGRIENPKYYEFSLSDGEIIRAEYHLHYIAYYRNGEQIHTPCFTFERFVEYEKDLTVAEEFFFLLALTCITENYRKSAKEMVLKWLSKTPLIDATFSVIADCIIQNNAEDRDTEECAFWENEDICLLLKKNENGYSLYEHTNMGLVPMALRVGVDWKHYDMDSVLKAHEKPVPRKIVAFEVEGLSNEEKAMKAWEGLMLYARHEKGGGLNGPVVPKEFPELTTLFECEMGWLTDTYVVLHRELSRNNFRKEVLYVSVGNWGCYSSYLRLEDVEKEARVLKEFQDKVKRNKYVGSVLEGRIIRDSDAGRLFSWTKPFIFGKNGKLYGEYGFARLCETESFLELLTKMIDFENVVRCEVFQGKMTVDKRSSRLDYCFPKEEYEEAKALYDMDYAKMHTAVEPMAEERLADIGEEYRDDFLRYMTKVYLNEMKEERYAERCETLVEYYCDL